MISPLRQLAAGRSGQRGFTLVEVMVALAILSLVMLAITTGLRTLANTQDALRRTTDRVDEMRTVSGFLRDALESAVLGSGSGGLGLGGNGSDVTFFRVGSDNLQWKSTVLFGEGAGGSYFLRVAIESGSLVLRWQEPTSTGKPRDWSAAQSRILVHDLDEFAVTFRRDFTGPWLSRWDRKGIPVMVRLQVAAHGRHWPELVFRVEGAK